MQDDVLKVHLHEMENDLIAGYYEAAGDTPDLQFTGGSVLVKRQTWSVDFVFSGVPT
jgi:hypothetical protein